MSVPSPTRVIAYLRCFKNSYADPTGISAQRRLISQWAHKAGYRTEVVAWHVDPHVVSEADEKSAPGDLTPVLARAVADVAVKRADYLVVAFEEVLGSTELPRAAVLHAVLSLGANVMPLYAFDFGRSEAAQAVASAAYVFSDFERAVQRARASMAGSVSRAPLCRSSDRSRP